MTEAVWLTIGAAVIVTVVMSLGSIVLSDRSAKRFDRLRAAKSPNDG